MAIIEAVRALFDVTGCGLMLVNPPWTLEATLARLLPFLAERLALEPGARHRVVGERR